VDEEGNLVVLRSHREAAVALAGNPPNTHREVHHDAVKRRATRCAEKWLTSSFSNIRCSLDLIP
jgi:hypothetical protein